MRLASDLTPGPGSESHNNDHLSEAPRIFQGHAPQKISSPLWLSVRAGEESADRSKKADNGV